MSHSVLIRVCCMKHMDRTDVADNIQGELRASFMKDVERKIYIW